jgi:hypothetical protein
MVKFCNRSEWKAVLNLIYMEWEGREGVTVGVAYRQVRDNEGTNAKGCGHGTQQKLSFSLSITSIF